MIACIHVRSSTGSPEPDRKHFCFRQTTVADLGGGGGFRGFKPPPPPLGLPKKKKINVHRKTPS